MVSLGIAIKKNELRYSVINGTDKNNANIVELGKQHFRVESNSLMSDFYNIFTELISKFSPDVISYKLSLDVNMQQIPYMHYSFGVLNLICLQERIEIRERSNKWITANKKAKIIQFENKFGEKYKNEELAASLVAWFGLE